jgi:DNA-binding PadR family transcriptional regulator
MTDSPTPPLTSAAFQVLLALACGHTHGYAVMGFVEELTAGAVRLAPGTLYRTIGRLLADGLIEEDPTAPHDARRRCYRMTARGRQAAEAEAALLGRMVAAAAEGGLLRARGAA